MVELSFSYHFSALYSPCKQKIKELKPFMKKMLCLVTLLCLTAFPALAEQVSDALAPAYSDSSAQLLSQETEDLSLIHI